MPLSSSATSNSPQLFALRAGVVRGPQGRSAGVAAVAGLLMGRRAEVNPPIARQQAGDHLPDATIAADHHMIPQLRDLGHSEERIFEVSARDRHFCPIETNWSQQKSKIAQRQDGVNRSQ